MILETGRKDFPMPRVLAFGTYNVRKHPRVSILIDGLRKNGCQVEEINEPLMLSTAQRVEILKKPWKLFGFGWNLLRLWHSLVKRAKAWMKANGKPDAVLVGYMGHFDVILARHVFKGVPIILDHLIFAGDTAKDRGAQGLKVGLLRGLDGIATKCASLVVLDTKEHQRMLQQGIHSMVVPVGASDEWYSAAEARKSERTMGVVFYGLYTPLQGVPVIAKAARILAQQGVDLDFTLIGKGQDYEEVHTLCEDLDNVTFLEWVEPEELPSLVASHAISLGIFSTTPKGLHVVPNKVYQSMAAGCAVITSDTKPQRRMLGDGVIFTEPGSARSLADAIESLVTTPSFLRQGQRKASETSKKFTDENVTKELAQWIKDRV